MENRNFLVFISISIAILLIWSQLYTKPRMEAEQARIEAERERSEDLGFDLPTAAAPGSLTSAGERPALNQEAALTSLSRQEALGSARVLFENDDILGTISLRGARIDDVTLKNYRVEIDENSPRVVLLSPENTEHAYFADFGWAASGSSGIVVPTKESVWTPSHAGPLTPESPLELTWENGQGLTFRRTISLDEQFMFTVTQVVENNSSTAVELFPYGRISRFGLPELENFFILHEGFLGIFHGELVEKKYDKISEDGTFKETSTGGWLGITDKFWLTALAPDQSAEFEASYSSRKALGTDRYNASYVLGGVAVQPGGRAETESNFFVGAKKSRILNQYAEDLGVEKFDMAIDWGWFFLITKPMFSLLEYFGHLIGNFGIAILIVTIIVKALLFPLANKSYESMSKMKKLQPEMVSLKERYADDKVKQQQEVMELYRREKVNPLAGCLPMFIQIPVFFALYKVLFVTIEMRQAPFFGWIQDLASPDPTSILNLFGLLPYDPSGWPLIGATLGIGIWPLIMGITMFLQMRMNPTPQDPIQEKMFTFMPIVFTFLLARFPAGLVIYWAWNNTLTMIQQYLVMRKNGVEIELFKNLKLDRFFGAKEPSVAAVTDKPTDPAPKAEEDDPK
jgi:YidC/Oxa1 family membrane protein insertase